MKYTFLPVALFLTLGLASSISSVSHASTSISVAEFQLAQSQSLSKAAQSIKQQTGGTILSTKTVNKNGQRVHKIKVLLPSGKVQTFTVSAQ